MEEDDDFTFPTVGGAQAEKQHGDVNGEGEELPFPVGQLAALAGTMRTSPLWPFSSSAEDAPPAEERATTVQDGEDAPRQGRSGRAVVAQAQQHDAEADDDVGQDRMDLLWEDFNDVEKHPAGAPWPVGSAGGGCGCRCHSATAAADTEFEETSTSGRRYGCGPTMLRASSRAGGAGQFFASGRSRGRSTTGWTLLLRFFRRLLAVDKTPPSRSRRHDGIYVG